MFEDEQAALFTSSRTCLEIIIQKRVYTLYVDSTFNFFSLLVGHLF